MVYDTMVSWTSVNERGTHGAIVSSNYSPRDSITSEPIYREVYDPVDQEMRSSHVSHSLKFGDTKMDGMLTKDNICLYQPREKDQRNKNSGQLCLKDHTFVSVERIKGGEFMA